MAYCNLPHVVYTEGASLAIIRKNMITIVKLIIVLFHVITIINTDPNISAETKARVVNEIISAVGQENNAAVPQTQSSATIESNAGSVTLISGSNPTIPMAEVAQQGVLGTIAVSANPQPDGSYLEARRCEEHARQYEECGP